SFFTEITGSIGADYFLYFSATDGHLFLHPRLLLDRINGLVKSQLSNLSSLSLIGFFRVHQ
ncbi:MAG: hypothetical protein PX640_10045, partial [Microcystis sp. M49629_WE12]|nr:hypothetical protein [Microcystis sp. M49629_WE12]